MSITERKIQNDKTVVVSIMKDDDEEPGATEPFILALQATKPAKTDETSYGDATFTFEGRDLRTVTNDVLSAIGDANGIECRPMSGDFTNDVAREIKYFRDRLKNLGGDGLSPEDVDELQKMDENPGYLETNKRTFEEIRMKLYRKYRKETGTYYELHTSSRENDKEIKAVTNLFERFNMEQQNVPE